MEDTLRTLVDELQKLLTTGNLIGQPMEFEDKIIIPVTKIGFGFGAGGGEGRGKPSKEGAEGEGSGSGAGAGAGAGPVAAIVVFKGIPGPEGVKVLQLEGLTGGSIAKSIAEAVSSTIGMISKEKEKKAV